MKRISPDIHIKITPKFAINKLSNKTPNKGPIVLKARKKLKMLFLPMVSDTRERRRVMVAAKKKMLN